MSGRGRLPVPLNRYRLFVTAAVGAAVATALLGPGASR